MGHDAYQQREHQSSWREGSHLHCTCTERAISARSPRDRLEIWQLSVRAWDRLMGRVRAPALPAQLNPGGRHRKGGEAPPSLKGTDQPLDALVVTLERILAEDGFALGIVQLEVHPVHAVVLALQIGLPDEFAPQP